MYMNSRSNSNVGKYSLHVTFDHVIQTKFQQMSHAVTYNIFSTRRNFRLLALIGLNLILDSGMGLFSWEKTPGSQSDRQCPGSGHIL
jgi:hypothetical protein